MGHSAFQAGTARTWCRLMGVSIVVGGQYGSEGKGKVSLLWAKHVEASAVVRVGGTNSGHTVYDRKGCKRVFRVLPTSALLSDVACVLPAGSYIDLDVLNSEIADVDLAADRLLVDRNAVVLDRTCGEAESNAGLERIGSTLSGTGWAVALRAMRSTQNPVTLASSVPELRPYLCDTKRYLRSLIDAGKAVVIEGTQGFGLSNYHAGCYPFATSRDTTAAGFLSETGLSPFDVEHVVMAIRSYPIRVAGNSGPLPNEIDWTTVTVESGADVGIVERTTVTNRVRRVARFDPDIVKKAIDANMPDVIVLNHVDYVDYENRESSGLSKEQAEFVSKVEKAIGRTVNYAGNGEMSMIKLCKE